MSRLEIALRIVEALCAHQVPYGIMQMMDEIEELVDRLQEFSDYKEE